MSSPSVPYARMPRSSTERPSRLYDPGDASLPRHVVAAVKLVLREDVGIESKKLGEIVAGTPLDLLEEADVDGCFRARVGRDSTPRGIVCHTLGWVTAFKDGERKLYAVGGVPGVDSMAARIASRRQQRLTERLKSHRRASVSDILSPSSPAKSPFGAAPDDEHELQSASSSSPMTSKPMTASDEARQPSPPKSGRTAKKKAVTHEAHELLTVERLLALAEEQEDIAKAEEAIEFETVGSKLGKLLREKGINLSELMKEWDRNRDGDISKQE